MYIYLNGSIVEKEKAVISPFDHGYLYGLGLFETFRIYNGHPFLLDDHLFRLNQSLKSMGIAIEFKRKQVNDIIQQLLDVNGYQDAYVRFNVSAGAGEVGLQTDLYTEPTVIVYMKKIMSGPIEKKEAQFLSITRNTPEGTVRLKSHHYLNNILGKREIGDDSSKEGLFLTEAGYIAEGVVSNVFWVKDDNLYTPSLDTGILNGVTRQFIFSLADKIGIKVIEGKFLPGELLTSKEAFITNSIQEIVPLSKVNEQILQVEEESLTTRLQTYYHQFKKNLWGRREIEKE